MQRNARQPFVFSDGTVIPAGAKLVAPSLTLQRDRTVLDDPDVFDGFRWVHEMNGSRMLQKTMVTTGTDYHLFGHGRHPWYVFRREALVVISMVFIANTPTVLVVSLRAMR